jgi:hypothetical protein
LDCRSGDQFSVPLLAALVCSRVPGLERSVAARQNVLVQESHEALRKNAVVVPRVVQDDLRVPVGLAVSYRG